MKVLWADGDELGGLVGLREELTAEGVTTWSWDIGQDHKTEVKFVRPHDAMDRLRRKCTAIVDGTEPCGDVLLGRVLGAQQSGVLGKKRQDPASQTEFEKIYRISSRDQAQGILAGLGTS